MRLIEMLKARGIFTYTVDVYPGTVSGSGVFTESGPATSFKCHVARNPSKVRNSEGKEVTPKAVLVIPDDNSLDSKSFRYDLSFIGLWSRSEALSVRTVRNIFGGEFFQKITFV